MFDYTTSEHHIFSIQDPFLRLKEIEQNIYGGGNSVYPNLFITDYSAPMIQAVVQEIAGNYLATYLKKRTIWFKNLMKQGKFEQFFVYALFIFKKSIQET